MKRRKLTKSAGEPNENEPGSAGTPLGSGQSIRDDILP